MFVPSSPASWFQGTSFLRPPLAYRLAALVGTTIKDILISATNLNREVTRWADGLIVGAMSGFISQLLTYGLSATTAMRMLPTLVRSPLVSLYTTKRSFKLSLKQVSLSVLVSCLVATLLNTAALYVDGLICHSPVALTLGTSALCFASPLFVMAGIFTLVTLKTIPLLYAADRRAV